ncbi:TetR/AcrR family transcriptional regulator [Novosphingobium sp. JCM 18896]|uniref:TetR/AcrR family transcriptional regulator n=1 Tax=Novosphingobium sp. JCM 18896 TaxID=2989731 RepID=UPI0022220394|nr:TetR/AcrR family transcriptional regulator [Novosphingobium sp. JCM 18896]MCW1429687.1 TetR/AcrR family transcriptional regulator [Novosphingobium sp. JCM 18896]
MPASRALPSAKLSQERSRATRKKIVGAALRLWTERGFDEGFEATTVDEIAERAGISRASVYYYFPKKEDILRELAWTTAEQIHELSLRSLMSGQPVDRVLDDILQQLGETVARSPKAAVRRMLQIRDQAPEAIARDSAAGGMTRAFSVVIAHAQEAGELPRSTGAIEIAETISSIAMGAIGKWALVDDLDLPRTLRLRAALVLAGVRALAN